MEFPSYTYSPAAENNANKHQQEELGMIDLNPVNILMTKSETSNHSQKIGKGLTQ